jgi:preprotein translocase subunit SecA
LGCSLAAAGRSLEATAAYQRVAADAERILGSTDPQTLAYRQALVLSYRPAGLTSEPVTLAETVLREPEREDRLRVLEGEDLGSYTVEALDTTLDDLIAAATKSGEPTAVDVGLLLRDVRGLFATRVTAEELQALGSDTDAVRRVLTSDAVDAYESHEAEVPGGSETMRAVEQQIMLQVIEQEWSSWLSDWKDPPTIEFDDTAETQSSTQGSPRAEFDVFGDLMATVDRRYIAYLMHVQIQAD